MNFITYNLPLTTSYGAVLPPLIPSPAFLPLLASTISWPDARLLVRSSVALFTQLPPRIINPVAGTPPSL
jgi:hypothetical protein